MKIQIIAALAAAVLAATFLASPANAEPISETDYWQQTAGLLNEYLEMRREGVFMDYASLKIFEDSGVKFPNRIRGSNAPGGHFARPPGSAWLKRVQQFRKLEVEGDFGSQCSKIPKLPSGVDIVCGFELISLVTGSLIDLDGTVSKFFLALICRDSPQACEPYSR